MKRIIREVITLVRIERWLVGDDKPLAASNTTASNTTARNNDEQNIEHLIEESIVDANDPADGNLRVIAQRILDAQEWEALPDGTFCLKRSGNIFQTLKEVE